MSSAQTQVGQVTLTPVQQPAPRSSTGGVKPRPAQPAAAASTTPRAAPETAPAQSTDSAKATKTFKPQAVPQGAYNLTGKVTGPATRLPAGSKVVLMVQDSQAPGNPLLQIKFGTAALPVPYQMYFTQSRLKADHSYFVQAKIFNAAGKMTHLSAPVALPATAPAALNLAVQAVR